MSELISQKVSKYSCFLAPLLVAAFVWFPWWKQVGSSFVWVLEAIFALIAIPFSTVMLLGFNFSLFFGLSVHLCSLCIMHKTKSNKVTNLMGILSAFFLLFLAILFSLSLRNTSLSKYENIKIDEKGYNEIYGLLEKKTLPEIQNFDLLLSSEQNIDKFILYQVINSWDGLSYRKTLEAYPSCRSIQNKFLNDTAMKGKLELWVNDKKVEGTPLTCNVFSFNDMQVKWVPEILNYGK